jgi:multicomponent Na+:H+ antiporter subunit E
MRTPAIAHRSGPPRGVLGRTLLLAGLWLVLVDGELYAPALAALCIAAAVAAAHTLPARPRDPLRVVGVVRFVPFFLWQSLAGGTDVALRALRGRHALAPELIRLRTRLLPDSSACRLLIAVMNLFPGTLCAALEGDVLTVHVIDRRRGTEAALRRLEDVLARMFGSRPVEPAGARP